MIALNRKMPQTCFDCPCMQTLCIDKEEERNIEYLIRYCAAANKEMVILEQNIYDKIPDVWMNWPKPKWCPWQEVYENVDDEESAWHMSMAGLGGSYD